MTTTDRNQMTLPLGTPRRRPASVNGFARALAIVVRKGKEAEMAQKATACCPRCGHRGTLREDFGTRKMRGKECAQSWCRACRSARRRKDNQQAMDLH